MDVGPLRDALTVVLGVATGVLSGLFGVGGGVISQPGMRLLGLEPRECAYFGDAERDVQAARNAGMIPLVAGFGYLGDGDDPAAWRAEAVFARPEELVDWLGLGR